MTMTVRHPHSACIVGSRFPPRAIGRLLFVSIPHTGLADGLGREYRETVLGF